MTTLHYAPLQTAPPQAPPEAPEPSEDTEAAPVGLTAKRVECHKCGKTFSGAAVVAVSTSRFDLITWDDVYESDYQLYCDHCNHVICWTGMSHADGRQVGPRIGRLQTIRGRSFIEIFLRRHPQAAGREMT